MRPRRPLLFILLALVGVSCGDNQQGYYGPCDEPLGLGAGCPAEAGDEEYFMAADACLKLASCGVIHVEEETPDDAGDDYRTEFERCVEIIQGAGGSDPGHLLLTCVEESTCADLSKTDVGDQPPDPDPSGDAVEGIVGWCGRFAP